MDAAEERKLALRIVKEAGAEKTAAAIKDAKACYDTILQTAIDEIGMEKLTGLILKSEPMWAYKMLGLFPDIGAEKEALVAKALEDERFNSYVDIVSGSTGDAFAKSAEGPAAENVDASIPVVQFRVTSANQYSAQLGLHWINKGARHQQYSVQPYSGKPIYIEKGGTALLEPNLAVINRGDIKPGDAIWPIARVPVDAGYTSFRLIESETRLIWQPTRGEVVNGQPVGEAYFDLTSEPDLKLVFSRFIG